MSITLECFDLYHNKLGWTIVAIQPKSKRPALGRWQKSQHWHHRQYVQRHADANLGLLLGKVIDVEGDSAEANDFLDHLLGNYPHMRYASHKSIHHLFINPFRTLTRVVVRGIEFRARSHQSLLPPSTHPNGAKYRWLRPTTWEVTELPNQLRKLCMSSDARWVKPPELVSVPCLGCGDNHTLPVKLVNEEKRIFRLLGLGWLCQHCRNIDVREARRLVRHGKAPLEICRACEVLLP